MFDINPIDVNHLIDRAMDHPDSGTTCVIEGKLKQLQIVSLKID